MAIKERKLGVSGCLVIRVLDLHCCGLGSIPGWRIAIPLAMQPGQKKKKKSMFNDIYKILQSRRNRKIFHTLCLNFEDIRHSFLLEDEGQSCLT